MRIFGDIYQSYIDRLSENVADRKKLSGKLIKNIISMIKKDPVLLEQYRLYSIINGDVNENDLKVIASEMCKNISAHGKKKISESNDKLFEYINKNIKDFQVNKTTIHSLVNDLVVSHIGNSSKKIIERVKLGNDLISEVLKIRESKPMVAESPASSEIIPNELLLSVMVEKIKNKYKENDDVYGIMESIITNDGDKMKLIFDKYKNDCMNSIDKVFESSAMDVKNKLLSAKAKVVDMGFSVDRFKEDILALVKLKETLSTDNE